jgi:hypothetical protein
MIAGLYSQRVLKRFKAARVRAAVESAVVIMSLTSRDHEKGEGEERFLASLEMTGAR